MYLPLKIRKLTNNLKYNKCDIGKSGDLTLIFSNKYVCKISTNKESLKREYNKGLWLSNYKLSPKPILYLECRKYNYLLKEYIEGKTLIEYSSNPQLLIKYMVEAYNLLRTLDNKDCNFISDSDGNDYVHGDFCLPNIIVKNNKVVAFIDLENSGKGDRWCDISWMLWSLMRNTKTNKHNNDLLKCLNVEFNREKYDKYIPDDCKKYLKTIV